MTDKQLSVLLRELSERIDREIRIIDPQLLETARNTKEVYNGPAVGHGQDDYAERTNPDNYKREDSTAILLDELRLIVNSLKTEAHTLEKS